MTGLIHVFAVSATVAMAALAVTAIALAVNAVDSCYVNMRARRAVPAAHGCPWCDDRATREPWLCDCPADCGMPLCQAPAAVTP